MGPTKRTLTQKLGLLGVVSFLSYTAAVVFAPLAYPGYNWMGTGGQRPERRQCAVAGAVESAQRVLQCMRGRLCDRRLHWDSGTENQAAPFGHLSIHHHGVDLGCWLQNVPARNKDTPRTAFPRTSWRFPASRQAPVRSHSTIASSCRSGFPYPQPERSNKSCQPAYHPARIMRRRRRCCSRSR